MRTYGITIPGRRVHRRHSLTRTSCRQVKLHAAHTATLTEQEGVLLVGNWCHHPCLRICSPPPFCLFPATPSRVLDLIRRLSKQALQSPPSQVPVHHQPIPSSNLALPKPSGLVSNGSEQGDGRPGHPNPGRAARGVGHICKRVAHVPKYMYPRHTPPPLPYSVLFSSPLLGRLSSSSVIAMGNPVKSGQLVGTALSLLHVLRTEVYMRFDLRLALFFSTVKHGWVCTYLSRVVTLISTDMGGDISPEVGEERCLVSNRPGARSPQVRVLGDVDTAHQQVPKYSDLFPARVGSEVLARVSGTCSSYSQATLPR